MTSVNVTTQSASVLVTEASSSTVVTSDSVATVTATTAGPRGPVGPAGLEVDSAAKVNGSIVYYDGSSAQFKADAVWTTTTLTDGGNF